MSKVLSGVATVASVAAIFLPPPFNMIAQTVAVVASVGAQLTAKQGKPAAQGSVTDVRIGANLPTPYAMGRTYCGGALMHDVGYGPTLKKVPNPYRSRVHVWSLGPVQEIEAFQADFETVAFGGGGNATGYYHDFLFLSTQRGLTPEPAALAGPWGAIPNWGASSKLSGLCAGIASLLFDKDGQVYQSGVPQFGAILKANWAYDPRKDSTYPGGSGLHRWADETSWEYTENPALHAITYARGRYQNGKKVFGCGFSQESIILADYVQWANVCDANNWKIGGTIWEPGSRWDNLKRICEAGGARPVFDGARLSVTFYAPKVSLDTITWDDLAPGEIDVPAMRSWRERKNALIPKYRSEAHKWEYVQAAAVAGDTYIIEDGEDKEEEFQFDLVQEATQASQLVAYDLADRREFGPVVLPLKPRFMAYGIGDALTCGDDLDELGLAGHVLVIVGRERDLATGVVTLSFLSETAEKHPFALGTSGVAPPTPSLTSAEDLDAISFAVLAQPTRAGFLTNESHTVAADSAGTVSSFTGAGGTFTVFRGTDDATADATFSVLSSSGVTISIDAAGAYAPSAMSADQGTATLRAAIDGVTIDKTYSIAKSRAGAAGAGGTAGAPAKLLVVGSDKQTITYDENGGLNPATQTTTFTAAKQNTTATVTWSVKRLLTGAVLSPTTTYLSAATGDAVTMTAAQFDAARGGGEGVTVTGTLTDGTTLTDQISVVRVQKGATGATGAPGADAKLVVVEADRQAFTFNGAGALSPASQAAVVTAAAANFTGGNVVWSYSDNLGTASATLAALVTATSTNVRTVPSTVFTGTPTRSWLKVTATGQGAEAALADSVTIVKLADGATGSTGAAAITGLLTNEAHLVPADSNGGLLSAAGATGQFKVYSGTADVSASFTLSTVANPQAITINYSGQTYTATASGSAVGEFGHAATDVATVTIRATGSGAYAGVTVDKVFTISKSKAGATGATGAPGADAKVVVVESDRQAFTFSGAGALSPATQSAVVTAAPANFVGGAVVWSYTDNLGTANATLAGLVTATSANVRTVPSSVFTGTPTRTWLKVTATGQGAEASLSDGVTIVKLSDGATGGTGAAGTAAITGLLTNEAHVVPADTSGNVLTYTGAAGTFKIYSGTTDVSASFSLATQANPQTLTVGYSGQTYTVTAAGTASGNFGHTGTDSATLTIRATGSGAYAGVTVDKVLTLTKSKTGSTGATGPAGPTLDLSAPTAMFTMVDGVLSPASQTITLSATVNGAATAVAWSIRQPSGAQIRAVASASSLAVTQTDLGSYGSLTVQATYGTAVVTATLERESKLSTDALNTVAYNADNAKAADGTILNISADGVVSRDEKKKYLIPLWAEIQANYTKFQTEAAARGVTTEKTAHTTAYNALSAYIASYSTMLDATKATAATSDLRTYIQNYHTAEAALVTAITGKAATTANWSSTANDNGARPADGATNDNPIITTGAGTFAREGNSVTLTVSGGESTSGWASERAITGSFVLSFKVSGTGPIRISVASSKTAGPGGLSWSAMYSNGGVTFGAPGGDPIAGSFTYVTGDVLGIVCDKKTFSFTKNGVAQLSKTTGIPTGPLYARGIWYVGLGTVSEISFVPGPIQPAIGSTLEDSAGAVLPDSTYKNSAISMTPAGLLLGAGGGGATYAGLGGKALGLLDTVDYESAYVVGKTRTSKLTAATGVAANSSILPANVQYATLPSLHDAVTISDTDNAGTVTINVGAAVFYPDGGGTVTFPAGGIPGCAYGTKYFIKRVGVDPVTAPTGTGWNASTSLTVGIGDVLIDPSNYTTRATGATPSPPPPPPKEPNCVAAEAWVETRDRGFVQAREIVAGDMLRVLSEDRTGTRWEACTSNDVAPAEAVQIRALNGFTLTCSITTPLTLRDGSTVLAPGAAGKWLPIFDGALSWSPVTVAPVGEIEVAHIRCSQATYAAGDEPGRSILTHNPIKP